MQLRNKTFTGIALMIAVPALITLTCAFIIGLVVASLWNYLAPLFNLPLLTTAQGLALFALAQILGHQYVRNHKPVILNANIVSPQRKEMTNDLSPRNKYDA